MARKKEWRSKFLTAFASGLTVTDAARQAGISRKHVYATREADAGFRAKFADAEQQSADALEKEARRRATEGVTRKKFDRGTPVIDPATGEQYVERKYSDTLLIFLLKGRRPDVFGDRVKVENDVNLRTTVAGEAAADRCLARLREGLGVKP